MSSKSWYFTASVSLVYIITGIFNLSLAMKFINGFLGILRKILPAMVAVFVLMFVVNLFIGEKKPDQSNMDTSLIGYLSSTVGGILSSGPIYMWHPLMKQLREKGVPRGPIATFLYTRAVKIPLLPILVGYMGLGFTVVLTVLILIGGTVQGMLIEKLLDRKKETKL